MNNTFYKGYYEDHYLAHHGILGMKWGKKNGPPYPLGASDHSASEKAAGYKKSLGGGRNEELYDRNVVSKSSQKKNFKEIRKSYKRNRDSSRPYLVDDKTKSVITSKISGLATKEDIATLKDAKEKWLASEKKTVDFFESNAYEKAEQKAYKETLEYIKKNDPEYLKEIIRKNNGETAGLDSFHDFRKIYEGYTDVYTGEAYDEWAKTDEGKARKIADDAWDSYYDTLSDFGNKCSKQILGDYGNKKLGSIGNETYSDLVKQYASNVIATEETKKEKR